MSLDEPFIAEEAKRPAEEMADDDGPKGKGRKGAKAEATVPRQMPESSILKEVRADEDKSLKEWLDELGQIGSFRVSISRKKPERVPGPGGKSIEIGGWLESVEDRIDEEYLREKWGGGTYALKVMRKTADGSYRFQKGFHRTVQVAGEPRLEQLPGVPTPPTAPATRDGESPTVIKAALDLATGAMMRAEARADAVASQDHGSPMVGLLLEQMRSEAANRSAELVALRAELAEVRNRKPEDAGLKERWLDKLMDADSARVQALRASHEAELRQLKDGHQQDEKRWQDRMDRERAELMRAHEAALQQMRSSFEREISSTVSAHNIALASAKTMSEVQAQTLAGEVKRLERDNDELRRDIRELRDKKDKPLIEQIKDMKVLKDAFTDGDASDEESSTVSKIVDAAPAVMEGVAKFMATRSAGPIQAQAVATAAAPPPAPARVLRSPDGRTFVAQNGQLIPAKRKPVQVVREDGSSVTAPPIDPDTAKAVIAYLEQAYRGSQEPEVVALSSRNMVPADVLAWIRDNDTDATSGVDLFMMKVAKLPSSSPLSTQAGRVWLRKVGKALIGAQNE